jgi:hypothetical protein
MSSLTAYASATLLPLATWLADLSLRVQQIKAAAHWSNREPVEIAPLSRSSPTAVNDAAMYKPAKATNSTVRLNSCWVYANYFHIQDGIKLSNFVLEVRLTNL